MPCKTFIPVVVAAVVICLSAHRAPAEEDLERSIREHRMGTIVVQAAPGAEVHVEQLRHEFWFGCALSSGVFSGAANSKEAAKYKELFLANFNAAVTENAVKWHSMQPRRDHVDYSVVDAILAWTEENDIPLRGHCLFWGISNRVQDWVKRLDDDELRQAIQQRATSMGRRYGSRVHEFDLNNEMIHGNYYEQRLGAGITKQMADWVKQGDPNTRLFTNDYDVLTGNRLDDYVRHIRGLLNQGVPLAGIGVQGHLHGDSFDQQALQNALDVLAQFQLPIRITEFNMPGQRSKYYRNRSLRLSHEEELAKARNLVDYYRVCFAHPAVEGILMWGFVEGANWIPVSSLYRRDGTPTPAAEAYRDLVFSQWWTDWKGQADGEGRCEVPAFYGRYRVTSAGVSREAALSKADGRLEVRFP